MNRQEQLKQLLNGLLEKVEETKDFIIDNYEEEEREEDEISETLEALNQLESTIDCYY